MGEPSEPEPDEVEDYRVVLGGRIREIRTRRGLSQDQFQRVTGLHHSYISSVERGKRHLLFRNVLIISAGLGVDPSQLVRGLPRPWPPRSRRRHTALAGGMEKVLERQV